MLKKNFDILKQNFEIYLFSCFDWFETAQMYGTVSAFKDQNVNKLFLYGELLDFIDRLNKYSKPEKSILLPSAINQDKFTQIISEIKQLKC